MWGSFGNSAQLCRIAAETAAGSGLSVELDPVTVAPDADLADFADAVREMSEVEDIDSVLMCFAPPIEPGPARGHRPGSGMSSPAAPPSVVTTVGMVGLTTGGTR